MRKLLLILVMVFGISFNLLSDTENPRCQAIAKSTGNQCKNHQWGECSGPYCYVHCR